MHILAIVEASDSFGCHFPLAVPHYSIHISCAVPLQMMQPTQPYRMQDIMWSSSNMQAQPQNSGTSATRAITSFFVSSCNDVVSDQNGLKQSPACACE